MSRRTATTRREAPVALILGSHVNALGIARSLGEAGYRSVVMDDRAGLAFHSRYATGYLTPNPALEPEPAVDRIRQIAADLNRPAVVFPTSDDWLIAASRHRSSLEHDVAFPFADWSVIQNCLDKGRLYQIAQAANVSCPRSIMVEDVSGLLEACTDIGYPCIVKPTLAMHFTERLGRRAFRIDSVDEASTLSKVIDKSGLTDRALMVQEVIPGPATCLYTLTTYTNRAGKVIAASTGHKIRQHPPEAGTILSGRVVHEPMLLPLGARLLRALGYYGISNMEFKRDPRDGVFKLIEINPRSGMWNSSVHRCGINMPLIALREALGERIEDVGHTEREIRWVQHVDDFLTSVVYWRSIGNPHAESIRGWLFSIRGKRMDPVYSWKDPKPALVHALRTTSTAIRVARRRPARRSRATATPRAESPSAA